MGESCDWVSGSLYVRLIICPHCVHSECIIDEIRSIAGKGRIGVVPICEVEHKGGWHVYKWGCLDVDTKDQNKMQKGCHRHLH